MIAEHIVYWGLALGNNVAFRYPLITGPHPDHPK